MPYEVPQFLTTCKATEKEPPKNLGVFLEASTSDQETKVVEFVAGNYKKVPVLVITRNPQEINRIYAQIKRRLVDNDVMLLQHLQRLRQRDDDGNSQNREWESIITNATKRHGADEQSYCYVTVTDFFGGRGHDYRVMDQQANDSGGMLVIATSIPDTREWIQWAGRTARQDKPGQFVVILSKQDPPFVADRNYIRRFEAIADANARIEDLTALKDTHIRTTLEKFSSDQARGAWLNELSTKYYARHKRPVEVRWPRDAKDKEFRDAQRLYKTGSDIQKVAKEAFDIDLVGPLAEWKYPAGKEFMDANLAVERKVAVMFVIDVSFSMDETATPQEQSLEPGARSAHSTLVGRLAREGAELGALTLSLMWNELDDLDLYCKTTRGEQISYSKRTSSCGGKLDVDMNVSNKVIDPVENIFWERAPPGAYTFWAHNCNGRPVDFWIREKHKGVVKMHRGRTDVSGSNSQMYTLNYVDPLEVRSQTRLQTSIECINTIIQQQLKDEDLIGLMTFATDVRTEFEPIVKQRNERMMLEKVAAMRTRGKTACYSAIRQAAQKLKVMPADTSKWVVALTDGKDTNSSPNDVSQAAELFKRTEGLNFALISLGNEVNTATINQMVSAANDGENTGMLVSAQNMEDVKKAFDEIADAIMAPTAGAM